MKKPQKNSLFLVSIGHSYNDIFWLFLPLVLPLLREEFHLSYTQSGLLLTFYTFVIAAFSFLSGHLGDLYGRGRILSIGFLLTSVSYTSLVFLKSFLSMLVVLGVAAIGVSTFHSLAPPLLNEQFGHRKGIVFGVFESAGSGGIVLMMYFFSLLVDIIGWRLICALIALIGLPLTYAFYKEDPHTLSLPEEVQKIRYSHRDIVIFFLSRALRTLGIVAIVSFIPLFVVDVLGLDIQRASFFSGMIFLGGIVGSLFTGWLSESYYPLSIIAILLIAALPIVLFVTFSFPLLTIILLLTALGICHIGFFPPQNLWLSQVSHQAIRGKMFGVGMTLDTMATAIAPGLFGFLGDRWGLVTSLRWTLLPLSVATTLFIMLRFSVYSFDRTRKRDIKYLSSQVDNKNEP